MKRNFGSPGRIDLAEIHALPPQRVGWLAATGALLVILLGCGLLFAALFSLGAHAAMAQLLKGSL